MSVARNVATVGAATLLSRLLGFSRDVGIAAVLGAGALADAYFAALQIPNLFRRLLAEGAVNSAFVPMWMRIRDAEGPQGARGFAEEVLGMTFLALAATSIGCILFAPAIVHGLAPGFAESGDRFANAVAFVRLSAPYVAVAGLVAIASAILNAEGRVAAAAFGLVVFNAVMVAAVGAVLLLGWRSTPETGSVLSFAIVFAGLAQLVLVGGALAALGHPPRRPRLTSSPQVRRFMAQAIPGVIAGGIPQLKLMAGAMVASSSQAAVSWLYYANRLYELPLGVISTAIAAVLVPQIAASVRNGIGGAVSDAQSRGFEIALGLALPSAVAFAVLARPIAAGLFERGAFGPHDSAMVAAALSAIAAGLPGHVLEKVLGAVSFAHEDTRTPMTAALCGLATAMAGALLLFPAYGHVGVAAAIAVSGWVGASLLGVLLWRRRWLKLDHDFWGRIPRIVLASACMGVVIGGGQWLAAGVQSGAVMRIVSLALFVAVGLAAYLASLQLMGVARLKDLTAAVSRRFAGG